MTLDELDNVIDSRLNLHGGPVIEFNRLSFICGIAPGSWWALTKDLSAEEKPYLFKAGGSMCLHTSDAGKWCKGFVRKDPQRFGVTK